MEITNKTHWKNLANYDYLGAYSLEGVGEVTLTLKGIRKERVTAEGGKSEDCIVANFVENEVDGVVVKPMVHNKTNCKIISGLYGDFVEDWIGKKIYVYSTTTKMARDTVPCLRIRNEIPEEPVYTCSECGKVIDKKVYDASISKYGVALCSAECLKSYNDKKDSENNQ